MKLVKLTPVLLVMLLSCIQDKQFKITVIYENGDEEIFNCSSPNNPYMDEGCVICDHSQIACNVRTYKIN